MTVYIQMFSCAAKYFTFVELPLLELFLFFCFFCFWRNHQQKNIVLNKKENIANDKKIKKGTSVSNQNKWRVEKLSFCVFWLFMGTLNFYAGGKWLITIEGWWRGIKFEGRFSNSLRGDFSGDLKAVVEVWKKWG